MIMEPMTPRLKSTKANPETIGATLFALNLSDDNGVFFPHVETIYYNRFNLLNPDNIIDCPKFEIEATQMGGINCIVKDL